MVLRTSKAIELTEQQKVQLIFENKKPENVFLSFCHSWSGIGSIIVDWSKPSSY